MKKETDGNTVGQRIRTIRKTKKITLIELAQRSGVQQATLSRIETGAMRGTVESHRRIAETLGISLAELYSDVDSRMSEVVLSPKKTRSPTSKKNSRLSYEVLLQQGSQKKLLPVLITLDGGTETDRERSNRGVEKFVWVMDGKVDVRVEKESFPLVKGDTLYFDASLPHYIKHQSNSPAKVLVVTSPPTL